ncbi:hypothetical protein [Halorussus sp. MSC15.2]|uniref:hypothetical protein n=1 Tax=Halorussus sp. MSC15.2 TaxID=2283638 RepID=UPI0013D7637D|nr:hypothetical protein [Halorussus sp. MSC15.2]NEU57262.1 hypothetical protein [Halorussus sp. MSC15.2]
MTTRTGDTASLLGRLQKEVSDWSEANFGDQPDVNPLLGTGEEAGELADALNLDAAPDEEELDAVGDVLVYLADVCARRDLDLRSAYETARDREPVHDEFFREWTAARGEFERSVLKQRQGIRLDEDRVGGAAERTAAARMLCVLERFAEHRGYSLADCIDCAWYDEVIDREWESTYTN